MAEEVDQLSTGSLHSFQLLGNAFFGAAEIESGAQVSTYGGDPDGILGFWLQIGLTLVIIDIWGVNQQMEGFSVFLVWSSR